MFGYAKESDVRRRLLLEYEHTKRLKSQSADDELNKIDYLWILYPNIHNRCTSMVSHISIMFGLSIFLIKFELTWLENIAENQSICANALIVLTSLDVVLYMILLLKSLRCLRSFGLNKDMGTPEAYEDEFFKETVTKFYLIGAMNKWTSIGIIYSSCLLGIFIMLKTNLLMACV
jgi:hypothetical protein